MNLMAYEGADARSLHLAKKLRENTFSSISALVGCEGGFAKEEVEIAKDEGFFCISLGPRILRAETAAISLLADIDYEVEIEEPLMKDIFTILTKMYGKPAVKLIRSIKRDSIH